MKLFSVVPKARVCVYGKPVSMCLGFPGLTKLVTSAFGEKLLQPGDVYLFVNKNRNYLKILWYFKNGPCLFAKRLHHGTFPRIGNETLALPEMQKLVDTVVIEGVEK